MESRRQRRGGARASMEEFDQVYRGTSRVFRFAEAQAAVVTSPRTWSPCVPGPAPVFRVGAGGAASGLALRHRLVGAREFWQKELAAPHTRSARGAASRRSRAAGRRADTPGVDVGRARLPRAPLVWDVRCRRSRCAWARSQKLTPHRQRRGASRRAGRDLPLTDRGPPLQTPRVSVANRRIVRAARVGCPHPDLLFARRSQVVDERAGGHHRPSRRLQGVRSLHATSTPSRTSFGPGRRAPGAQAAKARESRRPVVVAVAIVLAAAVLVGGCWCAGAPSRSAGGRRAGVIAVPRALAIAAAAVRLPSSLRRPGDRVG